MHIRHIAENITQPIVGTIIAKSIPRPMQNARKPSSLLFLKKLIVPPPKLYEKTVVQQVSNHCNSCNHYKIP